MLCFGRGGCILSSADAHLYFSLSVFFFLQRWDAFFGCLVWVASSKGKSPVRHLWAIPSTNGSFFSRASAWVRANRDSGNCLIPQGCSLAWWLLLKGHDFLGRVSFWSHHLGQCRHLGWELTWQHTSLLTSSTCLPCLTILWLYCVLEKIVFSVFQLLVSIIQNTMAPLRKWHLRCGMTRYELLPQLILTSGSTQRSAVLTTIPLNQPFALSCLAWLGDFILKRTTETSRTYDK